MSLVPNYIKKDQSLMRMDPIKSEWMGHYQQGPLLNDNGSQQYETGWASKQSVTGKMKLDDNEIN